MIAFAIYKVKILRGEKVPFRLDKSIILRHYEVEQMPYIRSICKAGKTMEIAKYYTRRYRPEGHKRNKKENKTSIQQQNINDRQTEQKLTRILNANFDDTSFYITFSYKKENRPDIDVLKKHTRKLLSDMRKIYKAEGKELKYVETAEVGERGAVHLHMVINDIDPRKIKNLWGYGFVDIKPLDSTGQYRRLANYFIKYYQKTRGTSDQIQKKAYNCSKNLIRPELKKKVMSRKGFSEIICVPKGWYLDEDTKASGVNADGYEYLRYTLIRLPGINKGT